MPYRENAYREPPSHAGHGLAGNTIHAGAPTRLRFCRCGAVIDENYHEVKTIPMRDWLDSLEATS